MTSGLLALVDGAEGLMEGAFDDRARAVGDEGDGAEVIAVVEANPRGQARGFGGGLSKNVTKTYFGM